MDEEPQESLDPRKLADKWTKEIEASEKELKPFHDASRKVLRAYLDKRSGVNGMNFDMGTDGIFRQNLFWSTTQVLLSNLYAKRPKVDVSRANKDFEDDAARVAGTILERILNGDIEGDGSDFDVATRNGIEDNLIVGLGQMWLLYEVETQSMVLDPLTGQPAPAPPVDPMAEVDPLVPQPEVFEQLVREEVSTDYVHWKDFGYSPARTWEEVRWVSRKLLMTKEQITKRFGAEIAERVPLSLVKSDNSAIKVQNDPFPKGTVFEIWCKETGYVYWFAKGVGVILDAREDPLGLDNFFPCPKPLMSNVTTSQLLPTADYHFAQDQYELIDEMTTRAAWLTRAIKAVGAYDKTNDGLKRVFQEAFENQMIPVDNWAAFAEKGGMKGSMDFIPTEQYALALRNLNQEIPSAKQALYEVLGIGDIMRGSTDPNETLGAQELKAKFGGTRLQLRQWAIANWAAEASRIKAEIMVRHFQPETLVALSGIERTPDAPLVPQAMEVLKGDPEKLPYRITIEADSMAAIDYAELRDARTQYLTTVGTLMQAVTPLTQGSPQVLPFVYEMLKWGMAGFKGGKSIESILDNAVRAAQQKAIEPPKPNPMEIAEVKVKAADAFKASTQGHKNIAEADRIELETEMMTGMPQQQGPDDWAVPQDQPTPPQGGQPGALPQ
jgi:hypothetical protein